MVSSHPIYVPVGHTDEIFAIFDTISYVKGAAVIRMMKHFLGDETFTKGMSLYLTSNQYSDASHDDLWASLTEQVVLDNKTLDVKEVMDTWILQMNYPLVTVTRDDNSNATLRVRQERFLLNRNAADPGKYTSPFNYTWNIPLTFASSLTVNFDPTEEDVYWLWKDEESKSISYGDLAPSDSDMSWFICNVDLIGFYRVNYDLSNWQALAKQLKTDHSVIPIVNRLQLINDAWNLYKSGYLELETAFLNYGIP
uniref:Peptidase M1 membrane alanine aminopeptidase domain-containing protein n=1 Tax=Biomphalaria glabrata TaxID=6526 RepID=A0A2C9LPV4_BIOGL